MGPGPRNLHRHQVITFIIQIEQFFIPTPLRANAGRDAKSAMLF